MNSKATSQTNSNATLQKQWCSSEFHNYLIMSMWVHKFFKWMISSSNFVVIAWLVILARKDPGTSRLHWAIILFSCNKDPELNVEDTAPESFYLRYWCKWHCQSDQCRNRLKFPHWTFAVYICICYCYSFCYCSFWTFGFFSCNNFSITIIQWLRGSVDLNKFFDTT